MRLSRFLPRRFLPEGIDLTNLDELELIFNRLHVALDEVSSVRELKSWIEDHSEVSAALEESAALRYIAMTCQTDDEAKQQSYLQIVEVVDPWLKPRQFGLMQKLAHSPFFAQLEPFYSLFQRSVHTQVQIFRQENVARDMELTQLARDYQKINAAMTVEFEGEEQTLTWMARVQEAPERPRRQAAWEAVAERRLRNRDEMESIFDRMLALRNESARAAGYRDFQTYLFTRQERFDYTSEHCRQFHDAIEEHVVPLARALQRERGRKLGLDSLRPWDLAVDPDQNPPLHPFRDSDELIDKAQQVFSKIDSRLGDFFNILRERDLFDLPNRKGKRPGGYQYTLAEARLPFIFMNAVGTHRDVETLIHEAGHAFHALASRDLPILSYRNPPLEFCEVASMAMELLAGPHLQAFYSEKDARQARRDHLRQIVTRLPWIATVDAFQHWIYTHPGHTARERDLHWLSLMDRFGGIEDWTGYQEARSYVWHRQLHIFEFPFYYIEYGIAQLGALQLWQNSRRNAGAAIDGYLKGLTLGGSQKLPGLFAASGLSFHFDGGTVAPLISFLNEALEELADR